MANLLYITCNVRSQDRSRTLSLGYAFVEHYLRFNPRDEVQLLDLYRDSIQRVDQDVLNAWERSECGENHLPVWFSEDERRKLSRLWRLAEQFDRCDKYVFVTHSLNLWFPAEFKMYIDAICTPRGTCGATTQGAKGILSDRSRKSLHLHAGPSYRFGDEHDLSVPYLRSVLNFMGVADQETVLLCGDDPERGANDESDSAQTRLLEIAQRF